CCVPHLARLFWLKRLLVRSSSRSERLPSMSTIIDTTKVTERRQLHFESLEEILADVDHLAKSKEILPLGNWSTGQVFQHLAIIMNKSIDGFDNHLAWPLRFVLGVFFKKKFLSKPMPPGFKLKGKSAVEIIPPPPVATEVALRNIRAAIDRLQTESKRAPSAFLGPMR